MFNIIFVMYSDKFKQLKKNLNSNIRPNMYSGWWKITPSWHNLKYIQPLKVYFNFLPI